jgi:hypothetical protein
VAANIQAFPKILKENLEQITRDIEYNYNLCCNNIKKIEQQFKQICIDSGISTTSIYDEFNISYDGTAWDIDNFDINQKKQDVYLEELRLTAWLNKYNQIKGVDWPELTNENDFNILPESVKKECMRFNFQPGNNY